MIEVKDLIGRNKYRQLKQFDFSTMSNQEMVEFRKRFNLSVADAEKQIENYEKHKGSPKGSYEKNAEYFKNLDKKENKVKKTITKEWLWKEFLNAFYLNEGIKYDTKNDNNIENIKPIIYYFCGDLENFKNCSRVSNISEPSLKKSLCIVGDFGNGKTTTMRAFERALKFTPHFFKGLTTNDSVIGYKGCKDEVEVKKFMDNICKGTKLFDDLKTERKVTRYGDKFELFKDVIELRYDKGVKTHFLMNYKNGFEGDLKEAINEVGERYGSRANDRFYGMCNIIEFKGKSFR